MLSAETLLFAVYMALGLELTSRLSALLPPANEVCEGYVFTGVCHSVYRVGGMRGCSWGGVCGCSRGACVVAPGGHAWLLQGGHVIAPRGGACVGYDEIWRYDQ